MSEVLPYRIVRLMTLLAITLGAATALSKEPPPQVSQVFKLTYLSVILPASQEVRDAWESEAWVPTIEQVTAAEKPFFVG